MKASPLLTSLACLVLTLPHSRAVDAEGVSEDHKTVQTLKPYDRKGDTTPADSVPAAEKGFRRAKIPDGFKADLWATEPLLANPVAFSFDGQGRMYIAETHRYRTSVLDIRHYMFMLEDDLANRNQDDWVKSIKKSFPNDWQELGKESEVVRLVEDTDGDGKADKSGVYADGFNSIIDGIASGVLARPDGVWLANIPGLYKLSGRQENGKAEKKEEVFRGFGVRFNYTGHDLHGLIKGPDGRIYFSIGDRGTSVKTKEGGTIEVPDEGAIFRCEEDGSHLELVMRGLRNPQELAFDDYGNLFTCDNDSDQGDKERFVHVVEGGDAGWRVGYQHCPQPAERNPWLAEHMWEPRDPAKNQPASILSPLANLPDGPGGFVHYPGTGLPEKYKGCFFLACYKGTSATSQVAVLKPVPDGASFKLEMLETFIPGCQATDVDFGPDSRMYVSFWDEGWERTAQGRIMKVEHEEARKAQAEQIAEVQKLLSEGMKSRTIDNLVALIGHVDQRVRLEAQWELTSRGLAGDKELGGKLAEWPKFSTLQKLHTVWAISHGIRLRPKAILDFKLGEQIFLRGFLAGEPPEVVAAMIRGVGGCWPGLFAMNEHDELHTGMISSLTSEHAAVRREALLALRSWGTSSDIAAILRIVRENRDRDQYLRHAAVMAISGIYIRHARDPEELGESAIDPDNVLEAAWNNGDTSIRRAVLLAVGQVYRSLQDEGVGPQSDYVLKDILDKAAQSPVASLASEALWMISTFRIHALLDEVASLSAWPSDPAAYNDMDLLRILTAAWTRGGAADAEHLMEFGSKKEVPEALRVEAFRLLSLWAARPQRDQVTGNFAPMEPRNRAVASKALGKGEPDWLTELSEPVALAALNAVAVVGDASATPALAKIFETEVPDTVRISAMRAAHQLELPQAKEWTESLIYSKTSAVRIAAAGLLGDSDPKLAAEGLAAALSDGTPQDMRAAFIELGALNSPEADRLITVQLDALAAGKVPVIARLELLEAAAKREAPVVKEALARYEASLPKDDPLAKFDACMDGGDPLVGKKLHNEHPVAACRRCHTIAKSGGEAGPALDGIASKKDAKYLLESIVQPNAQIAETFRMVVCTMKDGSVKPGVIRAETAETLTIQLPGEEPQELKIADISSRENVPSGMMPGLGEMLTKRELRDIMAYISTLKDAP